jgi:trans-4-hydroxy-L-proline dehydratase
MCKTDQEAGEMQALRAELRGYYTAIRHDCIAANADYVARRDAIFAAMDAFEATHPDIHPCLLKSRLHEEIAARCAPQVFRHSPFFFEMGVRPAESWGTPNPWSAASWMLLRRNGRVQNSAAMARLHHFRAGNDHSPIKLWNIWDVFDYDHHALGSTKLLKVGINGVLDEIAARRVEPVTAEQAAFLEAAVLSCRALLTVAERFAAQARSMLAAESDPTVRSHLARIAESAAWTPANPPRTFYEGLAMLWFLREATASFEGIGISVIGHLDRLLIDLYSADLRAGRLTREEAGDLLARWMLPTDVKFHVEDNAWPETSTCMELGGCDADGAPVFNELTELILETHRRERLLNPKPNCRISADAPEAFLRLIAESTLAGHNNFALLNDDVLIPACVRAGKTEAEARLYVNGGCQETIVEGVEHSAGAYYYFNLARAFDLCLRSFDPQPDTARMPVAEEVLPRPLTAHGSFEDFYREALANIQSLIRLGADWARDLGRQVPEIQPCPLFSATLEDCIAKARDYTAGGARYNPSGVALVGFGTVVDSLAAIQKAIFEDAWLSLETLNQALAANWEGYAPLRARMVALPKFGHDDPLTNALARRLGADLARYVQTIENERGDRFQASLFVYYMFLRMGKHVRATPDGRRDGEMLSQGVAPGRVRPPQHLTDAFRSVAHMDFADFPGNAVLDVQLPTGGVVRPAELAALIRAFAAIKGPTLQLNCVSPETLREAQVHPERHQDLIVRISGLSAHFVALDREVQDEIITRTMMAA